MKSMAMSAEEAKEYNSPVPVEAEDAPKYPYGLSLDLNSETLEKLGISSLPEVGKVFEVRALAKVTRVSSSEEQGGSSHSCCGLQITDMELNKATGDLAKTMYPDMD